MAEQRKATLPRNVKPVSYRLTLEPDLETFVFKGEETIELEVAEATSSVTLNAIELDIQACRMTSGNGDPITPCATTFDETAETATFEFEADILCADSPHVLCTHTHTHTLNNMSFKLQL